MLLGSDNTLDNIGDAKEVFNEIPVPILVISPTDLFGNSVAFGDISPGTFLRVKKQIEKRLPMIVNQYTGKYADEFNRAIQDPKFKTECAQSVKDGIPFSKSIVDVMQTNAGFDPGIVFIPGDALDPKVFVAKAINIKPNEVSGDIGSAELWNAALTTHELWHLARPELIMSLIDENLIPQFFAAVHMAPQEFEFYQEIMSDFMAMNIAGKERDPESKFMQAYIDTRVISALQSGSDIHRTGLALDLISDVFVLPKLSILQEASNNLYLYIRHPLIMGYFKKKHITNPTQSQMRAAAKSCFNLTLQQMIQMTAYCQYAGKFSDIDNYSVATSLGALERICPIAVTAALGPMKDEILASAKKVVAPNIEPEAPHYQAALEYFSDRTTIKDEPDGSKLVVRKDGTSIKANGPL